MPSEIKKFNLTYTEVPDTFALEQTIFFNTSTEATPDIDTMKKDSDRVCYLSLENDQVSDLKKKRLVIARNEALALAPDVSPDYAQGSDSGRLITELVYQKQYFEPYQNEGIDVPLLKAMGFIYINDRNELAGFSLLTDPTGEYPGWILATIQSTTAQPEAREVTVLATPNYVVSDAQSTLVMDGLDTIEAELKAAICNDKIANLIKGIFNTDGSVNISYLAELNTRLIPNQNLDDRDRKQAQLDILFSLGDQSRNPALRTIWSNTVTTDDINCFKTDIFDQNIHALLELFDLTEDKREKLKQASELYADIYMLAEEHVYQPKRARKFLRIADEIKKEIHTHQNIDDFLKNNAWARQYQEAKKTLDDQKEADLASRHNPLASNFFERNYKNLGYAVFTGITVGLILGLALITSPLPPLSIALLVIGSALICFGGISASEVYRNEKKHTQELERHTQELERHTQELERHTQELERHKQELERHKQEELAIITRHHEQLGLLRLDLPKKIQNSPVQELEQEAERPTNDSVSLADSCYSLWEKVPEQSVPNQTDSDQATSETEQIPPRSSQK